MTYRKKPVVIEAFQYRTDIRDCGIIPGWFINACQNGDIYQIGDADYIETLEGDMRINDGDWVIKGIKDELYPCRDDIFKLTYEAVE